jgi:3-hydroxybutyrate dehydrogenase
MENIQGKIALVTGGGSGINLAFVKLLNTAGCKVLIADLGLTDEATGWISSLPSTSPAVEFQRTDVTKWLQLEAAFDACIEKFGEDPDIVVPGAGIFEPNAPSFWKDGESEEDSRYKILDINLVHPIKTTRIAVRRLVKAKKGGAIIYVSSIAGQRSSIVTPLYTISKHGVNSLIRGMAPLEQLANIRVGGVAPG